MFSLSVHQLSSAGLGVLIITVLSGAHKGPLTLPTYMDTLESAERASGLIKWTYKSSQLTLDREVPGREMDTLSVTHAQAEATGFSYVHKVSNYLLL